MTSRSPSLESVNQCIANGDLQGAEALLRELLQQDSATPEVLQTLARLYLQTRRFEEAIQTLKRRSALLPSEAQPHFEIGNAHLAAGQLQEAIGAFRQGLSIDRKNPQAFNNLGIALKQQGALEEAEAAFRSAIEFAPQLVLPHRNLGELSRIRGDRQQALRHFEDAIRLDPNDADSHNGLGMTAATLAQSDKAISHFRKAIEINGIHREAENNLAILLSAAGQSAEAVKIFRNIIEQNPNFITARINLGSILIELGEFKEAIEHLEAVLRIKPNHAFALHHLGDLALADEYHFTETQLTQIKDFLDSGNDFREDHIAISFTYAGVLEKEKCFTDAFKVCKKANLLNHKSSQRNGILFEAASHAGKIQQTIDFFDASFFDLQQQSKIGNDSELPIFVVGMPRSGTTLVEQIISSHPQATGAGELAAIEEISLQIPKVTGSQLPYPECLQDLSSQASQLLGQQYLNKLSGNRSSSRRIVDKTWYNFYFLGLIATLFPQARIVHCVRDPRDVAISCFFSNFNSIHWSWKIEDITNYYKSYRTLIEHWQTTLPMEILNVNYEELVDHQEKISRTMIEFCGLDWDDDCLNFYQNQRSVQTASRVQVRKPIYQKSVGRWKSFEGELTKIPEWNDGF